MHCPFCRHTDSRVMDSRATDDGTSIRRRRQCPECGKRFTTLESAALSVVKRSGVTEPFSRAKVLVGVRKACQGRPVTEDQLALLAHQVEESIRTAGQAEIDAHEVGLAVLEPLLELCGHPTQLVVAHRDEVVLDGGDGVGDRIELAQDLSLADAKKLVDDGRHEW